MVCKPVNIPFSADVKRPESALQQDIMLAVSAAGHRLWRNNVGGWRDSDGRWVRTGLAVGSADLIGIRADDGRFLSIEVKSARGRLSDDQRRWLEMIRAFGGVAAEVRSIEEALAAIAP